MKRLIASILAMALVGLMGIGQARAQDFSTDQASVTANIDIVQRIAIDADNGTTLSFGEQFPGATNVTPTTPVGFTVSGHPDAAFALTWTPTSPTFTDGSGNSFGWNPSVSVDGASASSGDEFTLTGGSVPLTVTGQTDVPSDIENTTLSSTINLTVTYTTL